MDLPPCRYQNNDLILTESLGGLTRLLASSLDAFHNSSFFGLGQREQRIGGQGTADNKIDS